MEYELGHPLAGLSKVMGSLKFIVHGPGKRGGVVLVGPNNVVDNNYLLDLG